MIVVVFGYPGSGKTFAGKLLSKKLRYYLHDADVDVPLDMQEALSHKQKISQDMRDRFFTNILLRLGRLETQHENIVVTQTFIKEKYRQWIVRQFPDAKFILITAPDEIREERLRKRIDYPLDIAYARQMVEDFDTPAIQHQIVDNTTNGEKYIWKQLHATLVGES